MVYLKKLSFVQPVRAKSSLDAQNNMRRKDLRPSHARTVDWCFLRGGPMSDGGAGVL